MVISRPQLSDGVRQIHNLTPMERSDHLRRARGQAPPASPQAKRLAAALAERLDSVVPAPFRVRAEGGWVAVYRGTEFDGASDVAGILDQVIDPTHPYYEPGDEDWSVAERVTTAVGGVLSSVQDAVAEATTEPWPLLPGDGRAMAPPEVRVDAVGVYLWYGRDEGAAVISFGPIALAELFAPE